MGYEYAYRRPKRLGQEENPSLPQRLVDTARSAIEDRIRAEVQPMIIRAAVLGALAGFVGGILLGPAIRSLIKK